MFELYLPNLYDFLCDHVLKKLRHMGIIFLTGSFVFLKAKLNFRIHTKTEFVTFTRKNCHNYLKQKNIIHTIKRIVFFLLKNKGTVNFTCGEQIVIRAKYSKNIGRT